MPISVSETVHSSDLRTVSSRFVKQCALTVIVMVSLIFLLGVLGSAPNKQLYSVPCCFLIMGILFSIFTAFNLYIAARTRLPRTVFIQGSELFIRCRDCSKSYHLRDCHISIDSIQCDYLLGHFLEDRKGLVFDCGSNYKVAVGISNETLDDWISTLNELSIDICES